MGTMEKKKKTKATMPPSQQQPMRAKRITRATCKAGVYDMKHHPMDDVLRPKASKARKTRRARETGAADVTDVVDVGGGAEEEAAREKGAADVTDVMDDVVGGAEVEEVPRSLASSPTGAGEIPEEVSDFMEQPVDGEGSAADVTDVVDVGEEEVPRSLDSSPGAEEVLEEHSGLTQPLDGEASDREATEAESLPANDNADLVIVEQSNPEELTAPASPQASATSPSSQPREPVVKLHASRKSHPSDRYPGPWDPHNPDWHTPAPLFDRRQFGFSGNPNITLGALNQWVQWQGSLQTLRVFEMEAPTRAERLKYRHQRAILEVLVKELEDVEGEGALGD